MIIVKRLLRLIQKILTDLYAQKSAILAVQIAAKFRPKMASIFPFYLI